MTDQIIKNAKRLLARKLRRKKRASTARAYEDACQTELCCKSRTARTERRNWKKRLEWRESIDRYFAHQEAVRKVSAEVPRHGPRIEALTAADALAIENAQAKRDRRARRRAREAAAGGWR